MHQTSNNQNPKKEFIFFDNLNKISIFRFYVIAAFIVIMLLLGSLLGIQSKLFSGSSVVIISILLLSKYYWFKNYVECNDKKMTLKLGDFKINTIYLKKVDSIDITTQKVVFYLNNERLHKFDLSHIREKDNKRLHHILTIKKQSAGS